jgi:hypothetical protein
MRRTVRTVVLSSVVAIGGVVGIGAASAHAHDFGGGGGYEGGYGGGNYGVPSYGYYGNGGHDLAPHWHTRQTPYGEVRWYGNGRHDLRPHGHRVTPYGIESYNSPRTRSYSPPTPYIFRPW